MGGGYLIKRVGHVRSFQHWNGRIISLFLFAPFFCKQICTGFDYTSPARHASSGTCIRVFHLFISSLYLESIHFCILTIHSCFLLPQLGIPTANIPISGLSVGGHEDVESGVYFGWAGLNVNEKGEILKPGNDGEGKEKVKGLVYPMVMSIGWNPFYKNTVRSVVRFSPLS